MMYSRLLIARQLLKEDGVIFISIDDNEVHHLRKLCDEVFGEENFVANVIWQHSVQPKGYTDKFSIHHNHILVYQKSDLFKLNELIRTEEHNKSYSNPDNDPNGEWRSGDVRNALYRPNLIYDIITPSGKTIHPPSKGWRWSKETLQEKINSKEIIFSDEEDRIIRKIYLKNQTGRAPESLWFAKEVGSTRDASNDLKKLFNNEVPFDTPKPTELINRILQISGVYSNDIILDFFAGSGTTGQAVAELNQEDGGNRKYILVQLPEATDEKSEAYKAGYKKISDITIERNKRVLENIQSQLELQRLKDEQNLFGSADANLGNPENPKNSSLGFKVFKLQKSNFPRVAYAPDPEKTHKENIEALKKYIKDKEAQLINAFNKEELITEILLKNGFKLNYTLSKQAQFTKNEILFATDGDKETLVCLDGDLADETVEHFKKHTEQKLIVLERALNTTKKWNLKHYMKDNFKAF